MALWMANPSSTSRHPKFTKSTTRVGVWRGVLRPPTLKENVICSRRLCSLPTAPLHPHLYSSPHLHGARTPPRHAKRHGRVSRTRHEPAPPGRLQKLLHQLLGLSGSRVCESRVCPSVWDGTHKWNSLESIPNGCFGLDDIYEIIVLSDSSGG